MQPQQRMNVMGAEDGIALLRERLDPHDLYLSESLGTNSWLNVAENVAHEVGHAISLGVSLEGTGLSQVIDSKAQTLNNGDRDTNEALVLACEVHVLRGLGITSDYEDFSEAARDQDVTRKFALAWGSQRAMDLGQRVMRYIGRHLPRRRSR